MTEKMTDFFTARIDEYEEHMLHECEGVAEGYVELAKHIPSETNHLLDLGCGTGLELDEVFRRFPAIGVTGIDMTQAMLDKLRQKFPDKNITLICASYVNYDLGQEKYDAVISFETMHHLTHDEKIRVYTNLFNALKPGGRYIEGDYMVESQTEEEESFAEAKGIRETEKIPDGEFYHIDTLCSIDTQLALLLKARFVKAEHIWRMGSTSIIIADKML